MKVHYVPDTGDTSMNRTDKTAALEVAYFSWGQVEGDK